MDSKGHPIGTTKSIAKTVPYRSMNDGYGSTVTPSPSTNDGYESTTRHRCRSFWGNVLGKLSNLLPLLPTCYKVVPQGHTGLFYRGGRYCHKLPPGCYYCNSCTEEIIIIDTSRVYPLPIDTKTNRTKDGIDLNMKSTVFWSIGNVLIYHLEVFDSRTANRILTSKALELIREMIASQTAEHILTLQRQDTDRVRETLRTQLQSIGINVIDLTIDDIDRSEQFKANMMTKAHMTQSNENMLARARANAEADAIRLKTVKAERKVFGDLYPAILTERAMTRLANSVNAKVIVFGATHKQEKRIGAMEVVNADEKKKKKNQSLPEEKSDLVKTTNATTPEDYFRVEPVTNTKEVAVAATATRSVITATDTSIH